MHYLVKLKGRDHALFMHPRDAENYINSEVAKDCLGKPLYSAEDYTIEDVRQGRRVVGTTGHGHAILAALDRADAAAKSREQKP